MLLFFLSGVNSADPKWETVSIFQLFDIARDRHR